MRRLAAVVALLFAACSSREYAESRRTLIEVGMSSVEVRERFGAPERVIRVATSSAAADQTTEVWECEIEAPPTPGHFAALVLAAGALVLVVAAGGGGSVGGGPGFPRYRFWVGFGSDGRVRGVTKLEGVK
ncbi:MAG TPA: hypothetical protein VF950_10975 [Planctomycetota bacterium]